MSKKRLNGNMTLRPTIKMQRQRRHPSSMATKQALFDVNLDVREKKVTALIGPSGCGKSTFLRCLNRMNDTIRWPQVTGAITLDDRGYLRSENRRR